ncbi:MAG: hypothetical protein IJH77_01790, partial [Mogibacterium sp.]|nr:hypothetical protein [Mogibacterium sp.]
RVQSQGSFPSALRDRKRTQRHDELAQKVRENLETDGPENSGAVRPYKYRFDRKRSEYVQNQ